MQNKLKGLIALYLLWTILEIGLETVRWDYPFIHGMVKGGLMPLLAIIAFLYRKALGSVFAMVLGALTFSWFGDVLLIKGHENELFFIFGLASFLIAQVMYVFIFLRAKARDHNIVIIRKYPLIGLAIAALPVLVLRELGPKLGEMTVPVVVYTLAITAMVLAAVSRWAKTNADSFWLVTVGAFLFLLSDSLIAFDKFGDPITHARVYIMSTYAIAQLLILIGLIRCEVVSQRLNG